MPTTLMILARLLELPTPGGVSSLDLYADLLCEERALSPDALAGVDLLLARMSRESLEALRIDYFRTFRQSRETSLDMRDEADGADAPDSRRRLPAMLAAMSRAPEWDKRRRLRAVEGPLRRLHRALALRGSAYAGVIAALLELALDARGAAAPAIVARAPSAPAAAAAPANVVQLVFEGRGRLAPARPLAASGEAAV